MPRQRRERGNGRKNRREARKTRELGNLADMGHSMLCPYKGRGERVSASNYFEATFELA
jgi:hypothetical protein